MYHLYILRCADNTLYTGIAIRIKERIHKHNTSNRAAKYTRSRRPVRLVYTKSFRTKSKALREEYRIKQLSRTQKLALISTATEAHL